MLQWIKDAHVAQQVEHLHGKQEVTGSSPVMGSKNNNQETPGTVSLYLIFLAVCRRIRCPFFNEQNY